MPNPLRNTSISHGTMRAEDLIPTFLGALEAYGFDPITDRPITPEDCKRTYAAISARIEADPEYYYQSEAAAEDLEELFDTLGLLAPEGCYFGSHPGDGADYGFWEAEADPDPDQSMLNPDNER